MKSDFFRQTVAHLKAMPSPPCARTLGFRKLLDAGPDWVVLEYFPPDSLLNPMGNVQGGFLTSMLDDAMAIAGMVHSGFKYVLPTIDLHTSFIAPVRPQVLHAHGRVVRAGRSIWFLAGELKDANGALLTITQASARTYPIAQIGAAS